MRLFHKLLFAILLVTQLAGQDITLKNFGAVGDSRSDDTTAFAKAIRAAAGTPIKGEPGRNYRISNTLMVGPEGLDLDLNGGTIQVAAPLPSLFLHQATASPAYAVASGATMGSRTLVLAKPGPFPDGTILRLTTTAISGRVPPCFRRVLHAEGTTLELDSPLPMDIPTPYKVQPENLSGNFRLRNGVISGKGILVKQLVWICGFEEVDLDQIQVIGFLGDEANLFLLQNNRIVTVNRCRMEDNALRVSGEAINVWDSEAVTISDNLVNGEGFGIAALRCDSLNVDGNTLRGRNTKRWGVSVRGIKVIGCLGARIHDNQISDYENAIKSEDCGFTSINANVCVNCSLGGRESAIAVSNQNPSPTWQDGILIANNVVSHCGGNGISIGEGSPRCVISGNILRHLGNFGIVIFSKEAGENTIIGNSIDGFDELNQGNSGIYLPSPSICIGNSIQENTGHKPCLRLEPGAAKSYVKGNSNPKGNPMFDTLAPYFARESN